MKVIATSIPDVKLLEPRVFKDDRGFFFESYNLRELEQAAGIHETFLQDNHSQSIKNVLRGLHYQLQHQQGKLVRVAHGEVFDVAVDLRKKSPTYGKWAGVYLSAKNPQFLWIPKGFAHGFLTLSDTADFLYKTTDYYDPVSEHCIRWDDPDLAIEWPVQGQPLLSPKDSKGKPFKEALVFE